MPLPTDQNLLNLSDKILATFAQIFGEHPGIRPAHGKGTLLNGTFTPSAAAADLSIAQHFQQASTPVLVRFSDSTGLPNIPDTDPNTLPKGIGVRFILAEHVHTDVIAHSIDGFPTRTGEEFLEFLGALATSDPANPAGSPLEAFLGSHPAALRKQLLQRSAGRFIDDAVDPLRAEMALEGFHHVVRRRVVGAVDGDAVTILAEHVLDRGHRLTAVTQREHGAAFGNPRWVDPMTDARIP